MAIIEQNEIFPYDRYRTCSKTRFACNRSSSVNGSLMNFFFPFPFKVGVVLNRRGETCYTANSNELDNSRRIFTARMKMELDVYFCGKRSKEAEE